MFRRTLRPSRIFWITVFIGAVVLIYLTLNPGLAVTPVATADPNAAFGTIFYLKNEGIVGQYNLSSTFCVNSFSSPDSSQPAPGGDMNYGSPNASVTLSDLRRGDTVALPVENSLSGPPGSQVDLVFVIRFQPGYWFVLEERRFRFQGTETPQRTWVWKKMPLGSPCG